MPDLRTWGPATVVIVAVALIVVAVGGVVVIVQPTTLDFQQYLDDLKTFAFAVAGLGAARAVHLAGINIADANRSAAAANLPGDVDGLTQGVKATGYDNEPS